tara:strand:- start:48 stop:161 length:114 start_codon:yes stop_codon:yes gene_type:complete
MKCDFNELANNKAMYEHKVEVSIKSVAVEIMYHKYHS